ncbi:Uncharacterized protein TCM_044717 isoform 1, partial [Theobroma cacao]
FSSPFSCRLFPLFLKKPSHGCLLHSKNVINTSKSILSVPPTSVSPKRKTYFPFSL